jgi:hypothetical protein
MTDAAGCCGELESGDDNYDHLVDPELIIHAAMYRR